MRKVVHLPVDSDRADVRRRGERGDDPARMCKIGIGWGKAGIDGHNLVRMNRNTPDETVAARHPAALSEAVEITKVGVEGIERCNACCSGRKQALCTCYLVRERPAAIFLLVGDRTQCCT